MKQYLLEVHNNIRIDGDIRSHAAHLLTAFCSGQNWPGNAEVHSFLLQHSSRYLQVYMGSLKQRDLDGSHLWIREDGGCLTICRGNASDPEVENVEGAWTGAEIIMAKHLYQFTKAAKR